MRSSEHGVILPIGKEVPDVFLFEKMLQSGLHQALAKVPVAFLIEMT
jgi:hypothetical protein